MLDELVPFDEFRVVRYLHAIEQVGEDAEHVPLIVVVKLRSRSGEGVEEGIEDALSNDVEVKLG